MTTTPRSTIEARAAAAGGSAGILAGKILYGTESGLLSNEGKPFVEVIAPGAFKRSIAARQDIVLTVGHTDDPLSVLARFPGGGLTLTDTADGLEWRAELPDTTAARDLHRLVRSGAIRGASFEFIVAAGGEAWGKKPDGTALRTITSATLLAVNPVTTPAYSANTIEARRNAHLSADDFPITGVMAARLGLKL